MARFGFGVGRYSYFARPLPRLVVELRRAGYTRLASIANSWMAALGQKERYPARLKDFLARCAARGQTKPTPRRPGIRHGRPPGRCKRDGALLTSCER